MKPNFLIWGVLLWCCLSSHSQEKILLWPDDPELNSSDKMGVVRKTDATRVTEIGTPHLKVHLTAKTGQPAPAVILSPGGAYRHLVTCKHESIAEWLNEQGIHAFILMYRCPSDRNNGEAVPDIQRAIRMIRSRAKDWDIDPQRIGLLGTSAGANLSARASLGYHTDSYPPKDEIDQISTKPNFTILLYPAYLAHRNTRKVAPWIQIPKGIAPTLIFAARDDTNHFPNSPVYEQALNKADAPVRSHYFDTGGHGFGLHEPDSVSTWPELTLDWLAEIGILQP